MLPLFKMSNGKESAEAASSVLLRESSWACGPEIEEFEKKFADYIGRKYAVSFNSGTSALHAMFLAYSIGKRSDVIIPSFTFIATANSVKATSARPIFGDIEEETYGLNLADIENRITNETKAIMPIHYAGCPARDICEIAELASVHDLFLFEDAAQSLGASIGSRRVGTFGDCAMFSFCQDKIITTGGEGGILVLDDKHMYQMLKLIRSHGRADDASYFTSHSAGQYVSHGYNWRLSSMQAAIGIAQMSKMEENIEKRKRNKEVYIEKLKNIYDIELPAIPYSFNHVYQKFTIRIKNNKRDKVREYLSKNGIGCKAYFDVPVHKTMYYTTSVEHNLPITEKVASEVLSIPMYPSLGEDDIIFITDKIKEALE